ncbi:MAG: alkaline phosphatase family protein, partial [Planctomycetales bacterium]|nr:alkaline phosphatase family protein [Planctomycetales bacterium]
RAISRNEWAARLLRLPKSEGTAVEPGLILVQIDGLSRTQLERALEKRRLPFLRRLIDREGYQLHTMYSGLPSATPAVQGELFYGVPGAVPAVKYRDHQTGKLVRMFAPGPAADVQRRLAVNGPGLLEGGSAYSNIYSGGADESHFCAATFGWGDFLRAANPLAMVVFCLFHIFSVFRTLSLLGIEICLAVIDFLRGLIAGRDLWKELKFIPTRVGICVLMRDLNVIGASIDATRGLPVIHVNFLAYDEQSHRRGPSSAFAHWSLKGIDHAIRRISDAAHRSSRRDYLIWIYSDHGQEEVVPYPLISGRSIHEAVAEVVESALRDADERRAQTAETHPASLRRDHTDLRTEGIEHQRSRWLGGRLHRLLSARSTLVESLLEEELDKTMVTAMGPIAHVYLAEETKSTEAQRDSIARRLARDAHVPVALVVCPEGVVGWTNDGRIVLPRDRHTLLGESHPFLDAVTNDLVALCRHSDAGDVVLCGWRNKEKPISFPMEMGAHAGPGPEETRAFTLLPTESSLRIGSSHLRPHDLRQLALDLLHPSPHSKKLRRSGSERRLEHQPALLAHDDRAIERQPSTFRVLTYNVHSCIGMDGRMSPLRIARLIALPPRHRGTSGSRRRSPAK